MENRVFFPQLFVDQGAVDGKIELSGTDLILLSEGRTYKVVEAVRIVAEVTGAADDKDLVGKVKPKASLEGLGAEILENSMIIGDFAYDVVPGWMGVASTPFPDHLLSPERMRAYGGKADTASGPHSEEELLQRFAASMG